MILPFSQQINGNPTYFPEKIWSGLLKHDYELYSDYLHPDGRPAELKNAGYYKKFRPKIHTLREDHKGRWSAGKLIHMVIDNRRPTMRSIAPVITCTGVQKVSIIYSVYAHCHPKVEIDGVELKIKTLRKLVANDGFESLTDFFAYFNKDWTGKIIHWTNFRY